jgi:hypothetical protein
LRITFFYKAGLLILSILSLADRSWRTQMGLVAGAQRTPPERKEQQVKYAFVNKSGDQGAQLPLVARALALVLAVSLASLSVGAVVA